MLDIWWKLPGPGRFVEQVGQDLRNGRSVVLSLPSHFPRRLGSAIRSAISDYDARPWHTIQLPEDGKGSPVSTLMSLFCQDTSGGTSQSLTALINSPSFPGRVIYLDGMTRPFWSTWKTFIMEYEHANRSSLPAARTVFCVPLIGEIATESPSENVCLAVYRWEGAVDSLDMLLFVSFALQGRAMPPLHQRLAISIIANLSLWDPIVAERLSAEPLESILRPEGIFSDIANERGWTKSALLDPHALWHRGVKNMIDGKEKVHSAALLWDDGNRELDRRLWNAEVGVMLPYVEERRQEILSQLECILKIPFKTRFGDIIADLQDLEIGHIESQIITQNLRVGRKILKLIQSLRKIRNHLSHLEPLPAELLLLEEVIDFA